jgi:hypothetical protein
MKKLIFSVIAFLMIMPVAGCMALGVYAVATTSPALSQAQTSCNDVRGERPTARDVRPCLVFIAKDLGAKVGNIFTCHIDAVSLPVWKSGADIMCVPVQGKVWIQTFIVIRDNGKAWYSAGVLNVRLGTLHRAPLSGMIT